MNFWVYIHLLLIFFSVTFNALRDPTLPYYPIEISRMAATGDLNKILFPISIISLGLTLWLTGDFRKCLLSWVGLVILSVFDDKKFLLLHMLGVFVMVIGVIVIGFNSSTADLVIVMCALMLYVVRIALRVIVVCSLEYEQGGNLIDILFVIKDRMQQIMYVGAAACKYPQHTLMVFRVCGVLQWIIFMMFLSIV